MQNDTIDGKDVDKNKNRLMPRKENFIKPQFRIAGKFLDLKEMPSNAIAEHLELELAKRDELAQERLPGKRLRILKR